MRKFCSNCGERVPEGSNGEFCVFCGERIDGTDTGKRRGRRSRGSGGKNVIIAVLIVLLLCAVTAIGVFAFMFFKMSKASEDNSTGFSSQNQGMGDFALQRPEASGGQKQEGSDSSEPEREYTDNNGSGGNNMPSFDQKRENMPGFGNGGEGMPFGGSGDQGGGPGGDMEEAWLGDDIGATLSSICNKDSIPDGAEPVTDVSKLDGRWRAILYDSASSEYPLHYQAEVSVDGDNVSMSITDPGQFLEYETGAPDPTGDYSGKADTANDRITATLNSAGNTAVELRNIYTSGDGRFAAGVLTGSSSDGDVYIVLFKPGK